MITPYATVDELEAYTGMEAPPNAEVLLARASRRIDRVLIGAVYATDPADGRTPTDPKVAAALRDAVCAQVQWWDEQGNTTGSTAHAEWGHIEMGDVRLSRGVGSAGGGRGVKPPIVSPDAVEILQLASLLPVSPWGYG